MKFLHIQGKISRLLLCMILTAALGSTSGCAFPDEVTQTVGEAFRAVKNNVELKRQIDALAEPQDVASISQDKYAYGTLSAADRKIYDQMLAAINAHEKEVTLSASDTAGLEDIFACIRADYGGLFWVDSFRYTQYQKNGETEKIVFSPSYTMNKKKRDVIQRKIDKRVERYLAGIPADADDYGKVCYLYRKLIEKVDYRLEAENNQNIISVFLQKETVCQGYASALQYMLDLLDIPCVTVSGYANGGPHAWNVVKQDGEWYGVDVTWGNSAYHDEQENDVRYVEYNYFNVTSKELSKTHRPRVKFELPECMATADNYYVRKGRYYESFDDETVSAMGALLGAASAGGEHSISFKFADAALCAKAKQYFLGDYHIRDYCEDISSVYYNTDANLCVFTVIFP